MVTLGKAPGLTINIDFQFPMSDIIAVIPFVLPMLFIGSILLLYQRHLDPESRTRNLLVLTGIILFLASFVMLLYAGFGSVWWGPDELTFGSWWAFVGTIQALNDFVFGTVFGSVAYIVAITILYIILASQVISPPDPDFVRLRNELKEANEKTKSLEGEIQNLEAEKKRLTEFLNEKETSLTKLEEEFSALKEKVAAVEAEKANLESQLKKAKKAAEAAPAEVEYEQELLETISKKDQTISHLQSEIEELRHRLETAGAGVEIERYKKLENQLRECESRLESLARRAETAAEVTDSVISDLAELISQIESSELDPSAKIALTSLIEGLGRAVGRISHPPEKPEEKEPKIELIGAVMMVHEIVDGVKKLTRGKSE